MIPGHAAWLAVVVSMAGACRPVTESTRHRPDTKDEGQQSRRDAQKRAIITTLLLHLGLKQSPSLCAALFLSSTLLRKV